MIDPPRYFLQITVKFIFRNNIISKIKLDISSEKSLLADEISSVKSFMKNKEPKKDPCDIPANTGAYDKYLPSIR